jgi:hypothetical protein
MDRHQRLTLWLLTWFGPSMPAPVGLDSRAPRQTRDQIATTQHYMHLGPAALAAIHLLDGRGTILATAATEEGRLVARTG